MNTRLIRLTWILFALWFFKPLTVDAQAVYLPYSYQFYQKLSKVQYSLDTRQHTALKSYLLDSIMKSEYDSLMDLGVKEQDSWFRRKLFNEHLVEVNTEDSRFYADFLPDFYIGKDIAGGGKSTYLKTIGFQIGGEVSNKFHFRVSGYTNSAVFPNYINSFIDSSKVVPGLGYGDVGRNTQTWNDFTAVASYTPAKYLNISLGYDKNFIGDGYRSMLLSDVSANYTSLKLTGKLGNVQYMSMWSHMLDPRSPELVANKTRGKWGAFQYLDWNATSRLSVGFFQSIIWANRTEEGRRGFEPSYLNPIVFLRPIESSDPTSPDKMHLGINTKYKILNNVSLYGQFLLGEFTAKEFFAGNGYIHNKWGVQLGARAFDLFDVKNLNILAEFNAARPYTYSHFDSASDYSNFSQPLAHPLGANFKEFVAIANYSINRFDFSLHGNFAEYGLDDNPEFSVGKDIFKPYTDFENTYGNFIGQGIKTNLLYLDSRVSYILNPKYNLRLELGLGVRQEKNDIRKESSAEFSVGLRSSFKNMLRDF